MAMAEAGISEKEALKRVWMVDSRGLIVKVNLIDYALDVYVESVYVMLCKDTFKCVLSSE